VSYQEDLVRRLAEFVDREIHISEWHSIPTLNHMPPNLLEEARTVWKRGRLIPTLRYLQFFVDNERRGDFMTFAEDVVAGGKDVATWGTANCFVGVVEHERSDITLTIDEYIATLDGVAGERWFRLRETGGDSRDFPALTAGPGTRLQGMRYWMRSDDVPSPPSIRRIRMWWSSLEAKRIPDGELDVAIRRWMAASAACCTRDYLRIEAQGATVEGVLAALRTPVAPSIDGVVALRALVQEARSGDPRWPGQVGYIGPDAWYRA
jgi:hypothetical protein